MARIPDPLRIARFRKAPEFGPRLLFFSGGSALNPTSRALIEYTHNSTHVVTTLDSGGSSGKLRAALDVPAVGDLRSRIMALADRTVRGQAHVYELFAHRLPTELPQGQLRELVCAMADGEHPLVQRIAPPMRSLIRHHLAYFIHDMPPQLDLRGASVGNLILVGGYQNNRADLSSVVFLFSRLVEARGVVLPLCGRSLQLASVLADGTSLIGQHLMSGKEAPRIGSPIERIYLADPRCSGNSVEVPADATICDAIRRADLIVYPMGSFYSSVLANLLPKGICDAIATNAGPKVYIPNTGDDPEQLGLTTNTCASTLMRYARAGCTTDNPSAPVLTHVLLHCHKPVYTTGYDVSELAHLGIDSVVTDLVTEESAPHLDPHRLLTALLSLV